ncbi:MAG TPA: DUF2993 domain-containing protein [Mycobacteriales bacterium]|nr:DUF2993 domain-containing protein [Mycobacteriales bacterium]
MLAVVIVVICVLGLVADRVAVRMAQAAVASRLQGELNLPGRPDVAAHGFPFLTQVFSGRYDDVQVTARDVSTRQVSRVTVRARFQGLHAPLAEITAGSIDALPVDRIDGTVALPYEQIPRLVNVPGLSIALSGDAVLVQGRVTVMGQTFTASAHARAIVRDGTVLVTAERASVLGVPLPASVLPLVARGLSFTLPELNLPFGLALTDVRPTADTLEVSATAEHVVLRRGQLPATG